MVPMSERVGANRRHAGQSGVVLLEVLVAVLIFSIGLLGIIGMQAASVSAVSDAKYRSEAALVANQIIARIWADQANIDAYQTAGPVLLSGGESPLADLEGTKEVVIGLPPASPAPQMRTVAVTIRWQAPGSSVERRYVTETQVSSAI